MTRLKEKLAKVKEAMGKLAVYEKQMLASPDQQISLTDPDSRSMATSGPRSGGAGLRPEAAAALGVDPSLVFKTLVVHSDSGLGLAMVPVAHQLDLKAAAAAFGWKRASMAPVPLVERATGYVVGGVSPIGTTRRLPTVLDASALGHPPVFVSGWFAFYNSSYG